ncbi:MAG: alpha/beta fold hydrolase, partial [Pseudomonadota bacterium]
SCAAVASAAAPAARAAGFAAGPCPADYAGASRTIECGALTVPEAPGVVGGRNVILPVVIVRAREATKQPDPVIFLPGGPGAGVVERVPAMLRSTLGELVGTDRDWIFFDPRGVGLAAPLLDCGSLQLTDAGLVADGAVEAAKACLQRHAAAGVDLSRYNAETIAQDVAALRKALNVGTYNIVGISYGSRLAFAVQRYAPEGLRAVIHDSPYPPEAKGTEELPRLVSREVREVLAICAADPACAKRFPDLAKRLDAFAAGLVAAPKTIGERRYTAEDLATFLLDATYSWSGARSLPRDLHAILEGRMEALDDYVASRSGYDEAANLAHFCKEELPFESARAMRDSAQGDPVAEAVALVAQRYFDACEGGPFGPPNPAEIERVASDVPTLLLAAGIDAGCTAEATLEAVKTLARGPAVVFPNATHGLVRISECARGIAKAFLADPTGPVDRGCVATAHARFPLTLD